MLVLAWDQLRSAGKSTSDNIKQAKPPSSFGFLATEPKPTPAIKKYYGETTADEQNDGDEPEVHERHDDSDESANDDNDESIEISKYRTVRIFQVDGNDSISSVSSSSSHHQIPVNITCRTPVPSANINYGPKNIHTVKRSNKS